MGATTTALIARFAKPAIRDFHKYVHILVPIAVVLAAAMLIWIMMQHQNQAQQQQRADISAASSQMVDSIATLPAGMANTETIYRKMLGSLTADAAVQCARLRTPTGTTIAVSSRSAVCGADSGDLTVETAMRDGFILSIIHSDQALQSTYRIFIRVALVALLCGLSIAIVFNFLSHTMFIEREMLRRQRAEQDARDAMQVAQAAALTAEQANAAKSGFLATMSHEIRTPLSGIVGMADMLSENINDSTNRGFARMIATSGHALIGLLNDSLDLSKIDAGRMSISNEPCNLRHVLQECTSLFRGRAAEKNIAIVCEISSNVPSQVVIDPVRLRQVLTNLISNAIKYTDQGSVTVSACASQIDVVTGKVGLKLQVADTGSGIDETSLPRIFDRFAQAAQPADLAASGTGLGLAICQEIVSLMGGTISAASVPGEGSTFTVSLSVDPAASSFGDEPVLAAQPTAEPHVQTEAAVMIVSADSDAAAHQSVKLESRGYAVTICKTVEEARDAALECPPGAMIVNLDHAGANLQPLVKFINETAEQAIHIIGMSADPARLHIDLRCSLDALVVTPGPWDELLRVLAHASVNRTH